MSSGTNTTPGSSLIPFRFLERIDRLAHHLGIDDWWPFWRICDRMDLALGAPDTPANFPRRHRRRG